MEKNDETSFGVFKPVDHVVISFPSAEQADAAVRAMGSLALPPDSVRRYTDHEMLARIEHDMRQASPLASIGQEMNLVKAHRALAARGYHWLVVHAPRQGLAVQVAERAEACGAERAQYYGHFIIEELIEHPDDLSQVAESPDRGLDAQTPSGHEAERAEIRPGPPERV